MRERQPYAARLNDLDAPVSRSARGRAGVVVLVCLGVAALGGGCGVKSSAVQAKATTTASADTSTTRAPATTAKPQKPKAPGVVPTTAVPTTAPPTTIPTLALSGTLDFHPSGWVGFAGTIDGQDISIASQQGTPCSGTGGYADLAPGTTIVITDAAGAPIATPALTGGTQVLEVKNTTSERSDREDLIDAIYGLRVVNAGADPVAVAQLNLDRANLRLRDLDTPGPPPAFEGLPFQAGWCRLSFTTPPLAIASAYQITVTHRGTTTFTLDQIRANSGTVQLTVQ